MTDVEIVKPQKWFVGVSIFFLVAFWSISCATINSAHNPEELARTFNSAIIVVPKHLNSHDPFALKRVLVDEVKNVKKTLENIPDDSAIPMIIYMHGCGGRFDYWLYNFLAHNGYAVLAPNSFAREYKPKSCNPKTYTGGLHRGALHFRLAEANYAHEAIKKMPWVDKKNIFMMGFSQGGITTAKYPHGGLAGRIILGWTCNSGWPGYDGISGPRDVPILAVVASNDPWFRRPSTSGDCSDALFPRNYIESIVIDADHHDIHSLTIVKDKILRFLQSNRRF